MLSTFPSNNDNPLLLLTLKACPLASLSSDVSGIEKCIPAAGCVALDFSDFGALAQSTPFTLLLILRGSNSNK